MRNKIPSTDKLDIYFLNYHNLNFNESWNINTCDKLNEFAFLGNDYNFLYMIIISRGTY